MPWEWKEDAQTVPAQSLVDHNTDAFARKLITLAWWAILFSVIATIAFALLVGSTREAASTNDYDPDSSTAYSGGFTAGIVLLVIAALASFIIGIFMLLRAWSPAVAQEIGVIVAMGIVTLLSGFIFVGIVLGVVLVVRLNRYLQTPADAAPSGTPPVV